jgi:hypothetical protein
MRTSHRSARLIAFVIAIAFAGMFVCPAISAVVQERARDFCHHQNQAPAKTDDIQMRCCGQQAIAVNQFSPAADDQSNRIAALLDPPASNEISYRYSTDFPVFRFCKTADHLASLSILRI